jgi:hypothetical protein
MAGSFSFVFFGGGSRGLLRLVGEKAICYLWLRNDEELLIKVDRLKDHCSTLNSNWLRHLRLKHKIDGKETARMNETGKVGFSEEKACQGLKKTMGMPKQDLFEARLAMILA